jgi:SAM-dependent methyltransferase
MVPAALFSNVTTTTTTTTAPAPTSISAPSQDANGTNGTNRTNGTNVTKTDSNGTNVTKTHSSSVDKDTHVQQQYNARSKLAVINQKLRKSNPSCNRVDSIINQCVFICLKQHVSIGDRVIDLCCGQLGTLPKLLRLGISAYIGVDSSLDALTEGKERIQTFQQFPPQPIASVVSSSLSQIIPFPTITLIHLDLNENTLQLQNEEKKGNIALCMNAIHYLSYDEIFNTVQFCLLRKGGYFIVLCLDADMMQYHLSPTTNHTVVPLLPMVKEKETVLIAEETEKKRDNTIQPNQYPYPSWFTIHEMNAVQYRLSNLGLVENVIERRIHLSSIIKRAQSIDLIHKSSFSIWDIFKKFSKVHTLPSPGIKSWPNVSVITKEEKNLLCAYSIHVFQKRS